MKLQYLKLNPNLLCALPEYTLPSSSLLPSSLRLSDTQVYEPQIRTRLETASHFCEVAVLKLRTVPYALLLLNDLEHDMPVKARLRPCLEPVFR